MRYKWRFLVLFAGLSLGISGAQCSKQDSPKVASTPGQPATALTYRVLQSFPHDPQAFTQGLVYHDGFLYESTGMYGASSLRKVEISSGNVLKRIAVGANYFAEGLTLWDGHWLQLTWQNGEALSYQETADAFQASGKGFRYQGEGWGLTHDGKNLILSDGSDRLRFLDPETKAVVREVLVRDGEKAMFNLNELEYARGRIFANVWQSTRILVIDPATGQVEHYLDVDPTVVLPEEAYRSMNKQEDVLNGIAYRQDNDHFYVTGKNWPLMLEVDISK